MNQTDLVIFMLLGAYAPSNKRMKASLLTVVSKLAFIRTTYLRPIKINL
jgi:hypothetical protein